MASRKTKLTDKPVSSRSSEKSDWSEDSINSVDDISSMYKKMSQRDHVLNLPDTYIGSIEESEVESWVYDKTEGKMVKKTIRMIPGLYKIFDEILVNAIDQYERLSKIPDASQVREIWVEVYPDYISVKNDGDGIDVEVHPEHDVYVPELIFGNLLTSANYEKKNKTTGGKNGIGAKATNIFSKRFIVETVDGKRKRHFHQEFMDNMSRKTEPVIEKYTKKPYTKITFYPDFERFHIENLNDDMEALFMKRVYDITAITDKSVSVYLNGAKIEFKDFEQYVDLYIGPKSEMKRVYEMMGERWEVVVCDSPDDKLEHVSFVNGIYTWKGGKHVEALTTAISTKLSKYIEGKGKKKIQLKPSVIRDNMWIFAKTVIEDPSFDSQTKDYLTTISSKFGSSFSISDKFIEKVAKLDIVEKAIRFSEYKDSKVLTKTDGKKTNTIRGIPKLDDANWAGGINSSKCTLILTEGDSAKAFAIAGLSVIGRDCYGVFPLRGKFTNARETTDDKISKNEEFKNLKTILGLQQGKVYEDVSELRYGSILILTDADVDGSHIKGLLLNLFHYFWPSLLRNDGFIKSMMTPIVKAKHNKNKADIRVFYTLTEYESWKETADLSHYEIKYYKGLGTSSSQEAKEYFQNLDVSEIRYLWNEDKAVDVAINLAFNKEMADDRKEWLGKYDRSMIIEQTEKNVSIPDFVNKDLIHFSKYDCERSIPCMVDGFKPSHRKVIYGTFLKGAKKSIKIAQLSAFVAEKSAYHHGEQSLNECIIGLAQDFVGSNNMNFLEPEGQLGTRIMGGDDHASPRYIFTRMSPFMELVFHPSDNNLLNYLDDDGDKIEPEYYVPIIPTILVNGCQGIGTGFSTRIPSYNPVDIISNLKRKMRGQELVPMVPWFRGFLGKVEKSGAKYQTKGLYRLLSDGKVEIYELPIGLWTDKYKEFLEDLINPDKDSKKKKKVLLKYDSLYTESRVRFILYFDKSELSEMLSKGTFEKEMKLVDSISCNTTNMYLFNDKGQIKKYASPEHIMDEFYEIRCEYYIRRKRYLEEKLKRELEILEARIRFITDILDDKIILKGKDEEQLDMELTKMKYPRFTKGRLEYDPNEVNENPSYDYLTSMPIRSMTKKRIEELVKQRDEKSDQFDLLKSQTIFNLWEADLDLLEATYLKHLKEHTEMLGTTDGVVKATKKPASKKTVVAL
jgi:DNA topoisomerase-2